MEDAKATRKKSVLLHVVVAFSGMGGGLLFVSYCLE